MGVVFIVAWAVVFRLTALGLVVSVRVVGGRVVGGRVVGVVRAGIVCVLLVVFAVVGCLIDSVLTLCMMLAVLTLIGMAAILVLPCRPASLLSISTLFVLIFRAMT